MYNKEIVDTFETLEQLEKILNTFEENFSSGHTKNHNPKKNIKEDLQLAMSAYQVLTEQLKFIFIKRAATNENLLLQVMKILSTPLHKKNSF